MRLCSAHHVPDIMRGTFIEKGYRFGYTWQMCLKSVFRAHNETLNVWTHFIGFLIFAGLLIQTIYYAAEDHTPMPIFPSSNFTFSDLAQKFYEKENMALAKHGPRLPLNHNFSNFTSFHAISSSHHQPFFFSNFTLHSLPSPNHTFFNFSNFPSPLSLDFVISNLHQYYSNNTYFHFLNSTYHNNYNTYYHLYYEMYMSGGSEARGMMEHAIHTKSEELKLFLSECRDRVKSKMHSLHDSIEIYLKDIEHKVHDFSNSTHLSVNHLSERLHEMQEHFNENVAKFFSPKSKLPIMVFLFSGMVCFMGSTVYHTFGCQSEHHCAFFLKVDYSGISTLIAGSLVPFVWYIFHGLTHWQCFYVVTLAVLAALVLYVSFSERFSSAEYQPYRALCFVMMAAFAIVPFLHMVFLYGTVELYTFERFALSALLYLLGVAAYISRVPERLFPGKCDFWLQSHQVFHTFIVAAALVWYTFALRLLDSHTFIN